MKTINQMIFKAIFYITLALRGEWFLPELRKLKESQYLPLENLNQLQLDRLNALLAHANEHIPFYRGRLPSRIDDLSELPRIPLLEKEDVREQRDRMFYRGNRNQRLKTSGGSTGAPITLLKDSKGMAQEMAAMWRGYSWAGIEMGDRQVRFWSLPKSQKERMRSSLIDFVCNRKRIVASNFDIEVMSKSINNIYSFNPDYLYGYTSILKEFALAQSPQHPFKPKAIITTSEVLTDKDRELLTRKFNCPVYDEYGCGEVGTIAHECEYGKSHINSENMIVEIIGEDGNPVAAGDSGEVVVTDLTNWSTPLIRYRLKDIAALDPTPCTCGRTLPVLANVHGRAYDFLENSQRKRFHGSFFMAIGNDAEKKGFSIQGVQFEQGKDLKITVRLIAKSENRDKLVLFFKNRLYYDFDPEIPATFEFVEKIPREPSGKFRLVKRQVT